MEEHKITFTYLNIRQSITILLGKLTLTDFIFAAIIIGLYWVLVLGESFLGLNFSSSTLFLILFAAVGILKVIFSTFIILQWLNEYYEITPEYIYHKKGIIFRKVEEYRVDHIRRMEIQNSFLGELFNFATITLFDIRFNKYLDLYLIHNPERYMKVLKELRPEIESKSDNVRIPFVKKGEEEDY